MAPWTENVHCVVTRKIRETNWKHRLALAEYMWASTKRCGPIFFIHCVHAAVCHDVPCLTKNEAMRSSAGLTYLRFLPRAFTWRGSNRKASLQQIQQSPAVPEEFVSRFHFLAATNQFKFLPQLGNLPSASRHQEPCPAHNRSTGQER